MGVNVTFLQGYSNNEIEIEFDERRNKPYNRKCLKYSFNDMYLPKGSS